MLRARFARMRSPAGGWLRWCRPPSPRRRLLLAIGGRSWLGPFLGAGGWGLGDGGSAHVAAPSPLRKYFPHIAQVLYIQVSGRAYYFAVDVEAYVGGFEGAGVGLEFVELGVGAVQLGLLLGAYEDAVFDELRFPVV